MLNILKKTQQVGKHQKNEQATQELKDQTFEKRTKQNFQKLCEVSLELRTHLPRVFIYSLERISEFETRCVSIQNETQRYKEMGNMKDNRERRSNMHLSGNPEGEEEMGQKQHLKNQWL